MARFMDRTRNFYFLVRKKGFLMRFLVRFWYVPMLYYFSVSC